MPPKVHRLDSDVERENHSNNTSLSYIIIRQHLYDNEEVDDHDDDNYDNNDNENENDDVDGNDDDDGDDDDDNNNVSFIHACNINSTKAGGTEKNPKWAETN